MSRERELLKRALEALIWEYGGEPLSSLTHQSIQEIRAYLADTNPSETINSQEVDRSEPVAWTSQEQLGYMQDSRYAECEMYMWKSPGKGMINIPLYLHPAPRPEFVRLSEEEIMAIVRADPDFDEMMWDKTAVRFARAIENALEEKNK